MNIWQGFIAAVVARKKWSMKRLASEVGLSQQALSDINCGRSAEPRGMAAVRLYQLHQRLPSSARSKVAATD